ncbi:MAG: T9SS type A sorting domain-containing protein, partial [Bacteroidia bacterium]
AYTITDGVNTYSVNTPNGSLTISPTITTTYTVNPILGCASCDAHTTFIIPVTPIVSATASASLICIGSKSNLTATGASTYMWQPINQSANPVSVSPLVNTTYTVTGTDASGLCSATATVTVNVFNAANVAITPSSSIICQGSSVTLTASGLPAGNNSYHWQASQPPTLPNGVTQTVSPQSTTNYSVTAGTGHCTGTATATVQVVKPYGFIDGPQIITSASTDLCANAGSTQNFSFISPPAPYTYTWTVISTATGAAIPFTTTVTPTGSTISVNLGLVNPQTTDVQVCYTILPCNEQFCVTLFRCCKSGIQGNDIAPGSIVTALTPNSTYVISGAVTVNSNVTWNNVNLIFNQGASIHLQSSGTIAINNSHLHACYAMWGGITLNAPYTLIPSLVINNTLIEEASTAIRMNNPAAVGTHNIQLKQTWFNRNIIGIDNRFVGYWSPVKLTLDNCVFTSRTLPPTIATSALASFGNSAPNLNQFPNATLPPFNPAYSAQAVLTSQHVGQTGIVFDHEVVRNSNIFSLIRANVFDGIETGIEIENFSTANTNAFPIKIQNCFFSSIGSRFIFPTYSAHQPINSAIYINDIKNNNVTIGGALPSLGNKFDNVIYGVYSIGGQNLAIRRNTMNAPSVQIPNYSADGIYFAFSAAGNSVDILNNTINNFRLGIGAEYNNSVNATISNNTITNSLAQQSLLREGIAIAEFNQPLNAVYTIQANTITRYTQGVNCDGLMSPQVLDNTIAQSNNNTPGSDHAGIVIRNCHGSTVMNNTITNSFGAADNLQRTWQYGILGDVSPSSYLCGNSINGPDISIKFNGVSPALSNNSTIHNNDMFNANYANFMLDQAGYVGPQGSPSSANANKWNNGNSFYGSGVRSTLADNFTNGVASPFYYRNLPALNYVPTNNFAQGGAQLISTIALGAGPLGNSCFFAPIPPIGNNPNATARLIAQDSITYTVNDLQNKFHSKRALLNAITKRQIDPNGDAVLQNFAQSNTNTSIGLLLKADTLLNTGIDASDTSKIDNARIATLAFSPVNNPEANQQIVNTIFIDYFKRGKVLEHIEVQQLQEIAVLCPYTEGTAVFQARSLLRGVDTTIYQNNCSYSIDSAQGNSRIAYSSLDSAKDLVVYPNPADYLIYVGNMLRHGNAKAKILIFSTLGDKVLEQMLNIQENVNQVDLSTLKQGVYLYKIFIDNVSVKTERLILVK